MPGPIYVAGRTPLSSVLSTGGGSIMAPPLFDPYFQYFQSFIVTQPTVASGGVTAPSFPNAVSLAEGIGTRAFSAVTTNAGDYLVVEIIQEANGNSHGTPSPSDGALTYVLQNDTGEVSGQDTRIFQWTALDTTGGSRTVTISPSISNVNYSGRLTVVRGSTGPGGKANVNTAQTVSVARQSANSAIFMTIGDWNAGAVGTPVWTPGGTTVLSQAGSAATYVIGRWDSSGSIATVSHGVSSPSYGKPSIAVLEMKGTASGGTTVTGDAALTIQSNLTGSANIATTGVATLTVQSDLAGSAIIATTGIATLTSQSTLTASGVSVQTGDASLTSQSNLTVAGAINVLGISAMTSQSALTATGSNRVLGASGLSVQSALTSNGLARVLAVTGLSVQSALSVAGAVRTTGTSALSIQSALNVTPVVTTTGISTLTVQSALLADGVIGATPATSILSAQSALTATGNNRVLAVSGLTVQSALTGTGIARAIATATLSVQSNLSVSGLARTTGIALMTTQSSLTVSGDVGATPAGATLSVQSNLVAAGAVIVQGITVLSGQSTLTVNGVVRTLGNAALTIQSALTANGTRGTFGVSALTVQSSLSATGIIPAIVTGNGLLTVQAILAVDGNPSPPWVFPFIEFTGSQVTGKESDSSVISFDSSTVEG